MLDTFGARYQEAVTAALLWRLGLRPRDSASDHALIETVERALRSTDTPIDRFFFDAFAGALPETPLYADPLFGDVRAALAAYTPRAARDAPYWRRPEPCSMLIDEVEAIWAAIDRDDDWRPFTAKIAAIRDMGVALAG